MGGIVLVGGLAVFLLYGRIAEWVIRDKVLPRVEARLGRSVVVDDVIVGRGKVILRGIAIKGDEDDKENLIEIDTVTATYDYGASWTGDVVVHDVSVEGLMARPRRRPDGTDNFRELIRHVRGNGEDPTSSATGKNSGELSRMRPRSLRLSDAALHFSDESTGSTVIADSV